MLKNLLTYFKEGFDYIGLEITESDGAEIFNILELKKNKNELMVSSKKEIKDSDKLFGSLSKNNLLFLCITTSKVLTKKVESTNTTSPEGIVNQAFPNLDLSNFYYEVVQQDTQPIVSIAKKEYIDDLLERFKKLNIKISAFSLGISPIENVIPYLEDGPVVVSNQQISIAGNLINDIVPLQRKIQQDYHINGLEISNTNLLSFSNILGHLNQNITSTNFEEESGRLKWEFKNHRIFNQVLKYSLAFFITLLLGNFLVYNFYHQEVSKLNAAMAATSSQKDELTLLDASVERKQERVETLSASSNSKATYYLDLFAQNIPNSILLNEIKYRPLVKPIRDKNPILLEEGILLVSGISKDTNEFSFWIEELEKYEWVNSVETLDYDYISKNTSNFLIEIGFHEMSHKNKLNLPK